MGYSATLCRLDCGSHNIYDRRWSTGSSACRTLHCWIRNRPDDCRRTDLSCRDLTSRDTWTLHLRFLWVCVSRNRDSIFCKLGEFATHQQYLTERMGRINFRPTLPLSVTDKRSQLVPTSIHIVFAGFIFILSFTVRESPRYLAKVGRNDEALNTMSIIRNLPPDHPYIQSEMRGIHDQLAREREATLNLRWFGPLKELFMNPSNRYRIMIGLMSQLLSQWSGASSITIYAPQFFAMLGTTGQSEKLFATAIFGIVKLVASIVCALFLVDMLGRKRALTYGILLQFFSILYIAIYLAVVPPADGETKPQGAAKRAGTAAIVSIYVSGIGWALGWNSIQYLINAEIFPLRVRALGSSIVMCFHFANQ